MNIKRYFFLIVFNLLLLINAIGQKLPEKQIAELRVPSGIKIDGKPLEWGNTYQAYNTATDMFYTISNDDENLYLVAHIDQKNVLFDKVLTGGITMMLKAQDAKASFRYPVFKKPPSFKRLKKEELLSGKEDDPIVVDNNRVLREEAKTIEVTGLKNVDSIISIYNEAGIRVASSFDGKQGYTYELAVPLKHLGLDLKNPQLQRLSYQIMINGGKSKYPESQNISNLNQVKWTNLDGTSPSEAELAQSSEVQRKLFAKVYATTDFSGEYTLAK